MSLIRKPSSSLACPSLDFGLDESVELRRLLGLCVSSASAMVGVVRILPVRATVAAVVHGEVKVAVDLHLAVRSVFSFEDLIFHAPRPAARGWVDHKTQFIHFYR